MPWGNQPQQSRPPRPDQRRQVQFSNQVQQRVYDGRQPPTNNYVDSELGMRGDDEELGMRDDEEVDAGGEQMGGEGSEEGEEEKSEPLQNGSRQNSSHIKELLRKQPKL